LYFPPTPSEPFRFEGRLFHVKRDDLSHPYLSGNKYRKLYTLLQTPSETVDTLISYGGVQSNAMLSMAALCNMKGWRFEYTAKTLPAYLRNEPKGNLRLALELGMTLNEVSAVAYDDAVSSLLYERNSAARNIVMAQGGADPRAREGIRLLADEIRAWMKEHPDAATVATPSGTGTTAALLAEALPECTVVTAACVGSSSYLVQQIENLLPLPPNLRILDTRKNYRFATPDADLLRMYENLKNAGIEFDLIYAPVMWSALLENSDTIEGGILYVHSGGVGGNETMLARYARMGLVSV